VTAETTYPAKVGDIMLIDTYFPNYLPSSLRGSIDEEKVGARFNGALDVPSMSLRFIAQSVARRELNERLKPALYVPRQGPNYETPAEVTMLRHMGKETGLPTLGGMSTIPELEAANMLRMKTLALAVVTNKMFGMAEKRAIKRKLYRAIRDSGKNHHTLSEYDAMIADAIAVNQPSHEEVAETAGSKGVTEKLERIIGGVVRDIEF